MTLNNHITRGTWFHHFNDRRWISLRNNVPCVW